MIFAFSFYYCSMVTSVTIAWTAVRFRQNGVVYANRNQSPPASVVMTRLDRIISAEIVFKSYGKSSYSIFLVQFDCLLHYRGGARVLGWLKLFFVIRTGEIKKL